MSENVKNDRKSADDVAQLHDATDFADFKDKNIAMYESGNIAKKNKALDNMTKYAQDLSLVLAQQQIVGNDEHGDCDKFSKLFDDGWVTEGNEKQYFKTVATGHTSYEVLKNSFVPTKKTRGYSESKRIGFYDKDPNTGDITPRPNTVMFAKEFSDDEHNLYPYFKSGTLRRAYINSIIEQMRETYNLRKYHMVCSFIEKESNNFKKQIVGTGVDMFESICEVIRHLGRMQKLNNEYMIGKKTSAIGECKLDNLVIIMHEDIVNDLRTGIKTQTFNQELLNIKNVLSDDRVYTLSNRVKFDENDPEAVIEIEGAPYVDKNTIIVFDKRAIRVLNQLDTMNAQFFGTNITTQYTLHAWMTIDVLPWYHGFKYTNPNLSRLPADPNP